MPTATRLVVVEPDGRLHIEAVTLPDPDTGQVVVELAASGICHSQLADIDMAKAMGRPMTLGHEATGVVTAVGAGVDSVSVGDRVFVTWLPRDGGPLPEPPWSATVELTDGRTIGCHNVFTWAEHTICDEQFVVPMPSDLPDDITSIIGCAVMTGSGAVKNTAGVASGDSVAVFGVGGVGISAIVAAKMAGADPIIAVDLFDDKLEWARRQGATHGINASQADPVATIHELTTEPGQTNIMGLPVSGVDWAFDCIGGDTVVTQLLPSCRSQPLGTTRRGTAVLVGIVTLPELAVNVGDLLMNEKRLAGCIGGSSVPGRDFPVFCDWFRSGDLDLGAIVTRRYRLDDIAEAARALDAGEITGRAIIEYR